VCGSGGGCADGEWRFRMMLGDEDCEGALEIKRQFSSDWLNSEKF
jgi:hypothetical protein